MYKEEFDSEKFHVNRERDAFVERLLKSVDNKVTLQEIEDISTLICGK